MKNLISIMKYPVKSFTKATLSYYGIMLLIIAILEIMMRILVVNQSAVINNFEFSSTIFIFVMSLNILKGDLKFFSANGLTRKQLFVCVCISGMLLAAMIGLFDTTLGYLYSQFSNYVSFANDSFPLFYVTNNPITAYLLMWAFQTFIFALGFFISNTYYKLNKVGKVLVSVLVPGLILIGIPYLDATYFNMKLMVTILDGFVAMMGLYPVNNPLYAILSFGITSCILAACSYAMMRRAILKDA